MQYQKLRMMHRRLETRPLDTHKLLRMTRFRIAVPRKETTRGKVGGDDDVDITPKGKYCLLSKKPGTIKKSQSEALAPASPKKSSGQRSVGVESITMSSKVHSKKTDNNNVDIHNSGNSSNGLAKIPQLVEVDEKHALKPPMHQCSVSNVETTTSAAVKVARQLHANSNNISNGNRHSHLYRTKTTNYEEETREEQEYLRAQYLIDQRANRKKSKEKIVAGTKLAAATGATVGVAAVTAGIGLIAGMVALGVGGGTSALSTNWKSKRVGEIVIAHWDYDVIKQWKASFEACLESDNVVQRSK